MTIVENIFLKNKSLSEQVKMSEEYKKISEESYGYYKRLKEILNDEQKEILDNFADAEMGVCAEGEYLHFRQGLKVGLLLAMELLLD